jgi:hypothetical protein
MAKVIVTLQKTSETPWVLASREHASENYTQEEMDTILFPYLEYIKTIPGYDWANTTSVFSEDNNTLTTTYNFDTIENANAGLQLMFSSEPNSISFNRSQLLKNKLNELGVSYTASREITE